MPLTWPWAAASPDLRRPVEPLPDQVWVPPVQAGGLEEDDAFEPVSLIMYGIEQQTTLFSTGVAVALLGSETGACRFLELPGLARALNADDGRVGLAADGSRLAWVEPEGPVAVSVWDPLTGSVDVYQREGVSIQSQPRLAMSPDGSWVALQLSRLHGDSYRTSVELMDLATGALSPLSGCSTPVEWSSDGDEVVCGGATLRAHPVRAGSARILGRLGAAGAPVLLSPDDRYAAVVDGRSGAPAIVDLRTGEERPVAVADAPALRQPVLGWADPRTAVVVDRDTGLVAMDVVDGSVQTMVDVPSEVFDRPGFMVAEAALTRPPSDVSEPDWPMDPRLQILLVLAALGAFFVVSLLLSDLLGKRRLFGGRG